MVSLRWTIISVCFGVALFYFVTVSCQSTLSPPKLKQQAEHIDQNRRQITRRSPRLSTGSTEMEIVYPRRLGNPSPDFMRSGSTRQRRDDNSDPQSQWLSLQVYRIRAFNRDFLLTVNPRENFLAPNFVVQHLRDNDTWVTPSMEGNNSEWQRCFYSGIVNYERDSNVALSLCRGMFGIFRFKDSNYFIEPYQDNSHSSNVHARPHLIYKFKPSMFDQSSSEDDNDVDGDGSVSHEEENGTIQEQRSGRSRSLRRSQTFQNLIRRSRRGNEAPIVKSRHERSTVKDHYVELMVAADHRMRTYHGSDAALEAYILTLMAVVASVYRDASIGNPVHILLMKVIIIHNEDDGPVMTQRAPEMLQSFCQWQHRYNDPDPLSANHYDAAILLTRHDICRRSEKCDTLGLAEMGTICEREKSCAVVEDNGLSAAFTIIHELGHLFNLPHDSDSRCRQFPDQANGIYHVMAPTLDFNTNPWSWSECSRKYITDYLDNEHGFCLWNVPVDLQLQRRLDHDFNQYPGLTYDTNFQCQLVFGPSSRVCPYMPVCKRLWCTADLGESDGCRTQHMPWADGTTCGRGRWCIKGECVRKERQEPTDGQWSSWSSFGTCSRSCGGGIMVATRSCTNPRPANGGKFCLGEREKVKSCNTNECPLNTPNFREEQCAKYNGDNTRAERLPQNVFWVPKYDVDVRSRCKLYCEAFGTGVSVLMESQVIDGTKCGPDTTDICVGGICHPAGCDNKLYSDAKYDSCGVCGGDNSTCVTVERSFTRHLTYGYNDIVTIPRGAANILVEQFAINNDRGDENYLSLRASNGDYLLNGNFLVNGFRREIRVRGATFDYSGSHHYAEMLNTSATIGEDVHVMVLAVGSLQPARIHYKWFQSDKTKLRYKWRQDLGQWTGCDRTCQGLRYMEPKCAVDGTNDVVEDHNCFGLEQPQANSEVCNQDCQLQWDIYRESRCSVTCGDGVMRRQYHCLKISLNGGRNETQRDEVCSAVQRRPREDVPCSMPACYNEPTNDWEYSDWGQCSVTCGRGYRSRTARCVNSQTGREVSPTRCDRRRRQLTDESCEGPPCLSWKVSDWDQCSSTCGRAVRYRHIHCDSDGVPVDNSQCEHLEKPVYQEDCRHLPPCPRWLAGNWTQCSATCGTGYQSRQIWCDSDGIVVADDDCSRYGSKPDSERRCQGSDCPFWRAGPWSQCSQSCGPDAVRHREIWCQTNERVYDFSQCDRDQKPNQVERCANIECPGWKVSEWSHCSKSCGFGQRFRNVTCIPYENQCDQNIKPPQIEICKMNDCADWVVGDWSQCSITCGEIGVQTRSVECRNNGESVEEYRCNEGERPNTVQNCGGMGSCPIWHMTTWGPCSVSCGLGIRRRNVICRNETMNFPNSACQSSRMPADSQSCSNGDCAHWTVSEWSQCSVNCIDPSNPVVPYRKRQVSCTLENGVSIPHNHCPEHNRPEERSQCLNVQLCNRIGFTDWSGCSVTCGEGVRHRRALCYNGNDIVEMDRCSHLFENASSLSSQLSEKCEIDGDCAHWKSSQWSDCSNSCGSGEQRRNVWCESNGRPQLEFMCDLRTKPATWMNCWGQNCPRWGFSDWEECSESCGKGIQSRQVWCQIGSNSTMPQLSNIVSPHLCYGVPRPPTYRPCESQKCPVWFTTNFTECSARCGEGRQYRSVFCVLNNTLSNTSNSETPVNILPIDRCDQSQKPETMIICTMQPCGAHWETSEWDDCSIDNDDGRCGVLNGNRRRQVFCQDAYSRLKLPDHMCSSETKPVNLETCITDVPCRAPAALAISPSNNFLPPVSQRLMINDNFIEDVRREYFQWQPAGWSNCSKSCGNEGVRKRLYQCFENTTGQVVDNDQCDSSRLPVESSPCQDLPPCAQWESGDWSPCTATCGRGVQTRPVRCSETRDEQRINVPDENCNLKKRPKFARYCVASQANCQSKHVERLVSVAPPADSGADWRVGAWSQCSATCGSGLQIRRVVCVVHRGGQHGSKTIPQRCSVRMRPSRTRRCQASESCPIWDVGQWTECPLFCSASSPTPIRTRSVWCRRQDGTLTMGCPVLTRPMDREDCPCPAVGSSPQLPSSSSSSFQNNHNNALFDSNGQTHWRVRT